MREILFRGKRFNNGEWVIGFYAKKDGATFISEIGQYASGKSYFSDVLVNPATVGQYTGLTDKNGKKIFEGDAIRFHKFRDEPDWVGVVRYENCHYIAIGRMPLAYEKRIDKEAFYCPFEVAMSGIAKETIEVIGNIHDNPELMEV